MNTKYEFYNLRIDEDYTEDCIICFGYILRNKEPIFGKLFFRHKIFTECEEGTEITKEDMREFEEELSSVEDFYDFDNLYKCEFTDTEDNEVNISSNDIKFQTSLCFEYKEFLTLVEEYKSSKDELEG